MSAKKPIDPAAYKRHADYMAGKVRSEVDGKRRELATIRQEIERLTERAEELERQIAHAPPIGQRTPDDLTTQG